MIVRLTPTQEQQAEARLERIALQFAGASDRAGVPWSADKWRLGVRAEIAAAIATGHAVAAGLRERYDLVGAPIHVRSSNLRTRFAVQPSELPKYQAGDVIVAVFALGEELDVAGWLWAVAAPTVGTLRAVGKHPPAWWIHRHSLSELRAMPGYAGPVPSATTQRTVIRFTCHYCKAQLDSEELVHEPVGDRVWRRHRTPCWSDDVP